MEGRFKHESSSSTKSSSNAPPPYSAVNNSATAAAVAAAAASVQPAPDANAPGPPEGGTTTMPPTPATSSTSSAPPLPGLVNPASFAGGAGQQQPVLASTSKLGIAHRPAVFDKLEQLVRDMQDVEHGVPVRSQKLFITTIPAAFMGYDLIEWLMDRLSIEDSLEAVHLANLLCQFGYYFPIQELKNLMVKDDSSLYRFQTPYYWPSQHHTPDNIEYAIYLAKRSQRNKQKHGLEDYELDAYNNLKKILTSKWDFVTMQADEQLKLNKDRKKGDKIVTDSQEKAYWRVYRPPPGFTTVVESSPVPTREQRIKARSRTREHLTEELVFLKNYALMARAKVSQVAESVIEYTEDFYEFDAVLNPNSVGPSNPWITDDQSYWILNQPLVDCPTEKRVRKWSISLEHLISDPQGVLELMAYLKREYSHENLRFWLAVQELRTGPGAEAKIKKKVKEIWDEFLSPGAKAEINIDGKTMECTKVAIKSPTRYTYEVAAEHVYTLLLKKDCYPRFIRSDHYKALSANSVNPGNKPKRFPFTFAVKKKGSSAQNPAGGITVGGQVVSNPKAALEGCNIYGADGTEDMPTGDAPTINSANRLLSCDLDDSVCPWDIGPLDEAGSSNAIVDVAPRQHHRDLSPRPDHSTSAGNSNSLQQQSRSSREGGGLTRESSRSSRRSGGEAGGHHHRHHDHHHHHEHHHSASKRAKSKSKRKKSTRSKGTASSSTNTGGGADKENVASTAEMLASTVASTAASTVAVAVSSTAASVAAANTNEDKEGLPAGMVRGGLDEEAMSTTIDLLQTTGAGATSSKCTQTKLDGGVGVGGGGVGDQQQVARTEREGEGNHQKERSRLGEWRSLDELDRAKPESDSLDAAEGATKKELGPLGTKGSWAAGSSTEVCPWEDE